MKISIIVPVYNAKNTLKKLVDSVLSQDYNDYELILINDGSTDNSYEIMKSFSKMDNRIISFTKKNSGPGLTRKFGLEKASGDLIYFLDADDWVTSDDSFSYINEIFTKYPMIDFLIYDREDIDGDKKENLQAFKYLDEGLHSIDEIREPIRAGLGCKIFKRSLLTNIPFIESKVYEDLYTTYLYFDKANNFYYTKKNLYTVFHDGMQTTLSNDKKINKFKCSIKILVDLYNSLNNYSLKRSLEQIMPSFFMRYCFNNFFRKKANKDVMNEIKSISSILFFNNVKYNYFNSSKIRMFIYTIFINFYYLFHKKELNNIALKNKYNRKKMYLFACIEKNIGDDLFIYCVCKRYPFIDFIISDQANYMKINNISNLRYSKKLKNWIRFANSDPNSIIKSIIVRFLENIFKFKLKKLDSIYIVGNAFKNMNYKGEKQLFWLKRRVNLSNKFFLLSTNYGPSNNDKWIDDCKNVFKTIDDVCLRDRKSFELFKDLPNVRYAPDAVISCVLPEYNKNDNYIVISIIDCLLNERSEKLKKTALDYEKKMSSIINSFTKNNYNIVLLNSNSLQDNPASQRILKMCNDMDKIKIINYNGNLKEVFNIFENAKAILATRLHTIILGWLYNIPTIPIVYDIKVKYLLESYEFNNANFDINDLKDLNYNKILNIINNYEFSLNSNLIVASNEQFMNT